MTSISFSKQQHIPDITLTSTKLTKLNSLLLALKLDIIEQQHIPDITLTSTKLTKSNSLLLALKLEIIELKEPKIVQAVLVEF